MAFVGSSRSSVGVNVALNTNGSSVDDTAPIAPLSTVTSVASNPVGASENVKVTSDVSPTLRAALSMV
ncbi:hypothetical protein M0Q39_05960, partial [Patescibacteria group bacterium]|nr:hypothetical protein [Patescibacteria group bacterium]